MPKKSDPVTDEELTRLADTFLELQQELRAVARRLETTYMAGQAPKSQTLMAFTALADAATEVVRFSLGKKALAEDRAELEKTLRERQEASP